MILLSSKLSNILRAGRRCELLEPSIRSVQSVHLKLQNFLRCDPEYRGAGMKAGSQKEVDVWLEFAADPIRLRRVAQSVRQLMLAPEELQPEELQQVGFETEVEAPEGALLTRLHRVRERSSAIVQARKAQAMKACGALSCEVCGFDFAQRFGQRGLGFIECHHRQPLSLLEPGSKSRPADLALVCANCHRMLHRGKPWPSIEELSALWKARST